MELIPSRLTSWVMWRDRYTEIGQEPFNLLKNQIGVLSRASWENANGGKCPVCHGDEAVVHPDGDRLIYCICYMLEWQIGISVSYKDIQTRVQPAKLSDITYPNLPASRGNPNLALKKAVTAAEDFIKSPSSWLVLLGGYGSGKTHILRSIKTMLSPIAIYVSAKDLEDMTHAYRKADDMQELYSQMRYAPVLLLDDLGSEYGGPLVISMIDRIVDARYERWPDYPIVAASNMRKEELIGYIPRAGDRLNDLAKVNIVSMSQVPSYRQINPYMR